MAADRLQNPRPHAGGGSALPWKGPYWREVAQYNRGMAKQLDSSRRIAHSSDKGSSRDRLAEIEPHIEVQERFGRVGGLAAEGMAAASGPVAGLGGPVDRLRWGLSVPPVPRLPQLPRVILTRQLGSLPSRQSGRGVAAHSELPKPYLDSQRDASLDLTLAAYDPAFADQFRGVILRSKERGPDWLTQAAASCRKLLLGLLHTAAPNERVLPWAKNQGAQLDRNGRPTRRTKIDWLCRSIQNRAYRRFVRSDLNTVLEVLALCNQAVHVNESPDFEESFELAIAGVESGIRHIIQLSGHQRSKWPETR